MNEVLLKGSSPSVTLFDDSAGDEATSKKEQNRVLLLP